MPELPEVETTRRGIAPVLEGHCVNKLVVRERRLRWPVPDGLEDLLCGQVIRHVERRAKYLLLETANGTAMVHLGMSGSMRIVDATEPPESHDHFDIVVVGGDVVRFNDPRRFGSLLWAGLSPEDHPLLAELGPEPLSDEFTGEYLWQSARGRRVAIKQHVMNSKIVAGVGNIYANESLFRAGIHPGRAAGRIALPRMRKLADEIRAVLTEAIRQGGTTLRDYRGGDGKPGYFKQQLLVYERGGEPCKRCRKPLKQIMQGQRATYYCGTCQR
ncbi:MAG: bifunctional DNA-formamidopyrimidine glycosylase/DNA-(apurinic or apyrimidinic site) lyase [Gammaproteobacteria bacterium]|jgi:formamidopyrimidine-DNA glycosylase|nr:bifunctional DNA-formamidopyrimidine glycosylase/DNA-(apurinic or apyrimidinic site) lyase [Gammaproteobacteria bacterium]MDP6617577.1 bifunctional DNA-formamidopyrimidine glycosylase/DNA-(apurinic or apyrimidinic site) lyase [Gammaproteobacteria bacterium]MDP6694454.1 bifunctional DNA-formamidopyrimidine glycosylase/DNA-(apurinic or apyrimidinic site) lyase [Gammaproteobacteria bacterium]MDP7041343.1 bifunctional DNA-formamidopyrimidine glycosylase/DNA-(apurinic or apyrimidinic site) lyase [